MTDSEKLDLILEMVSGMGTRLDSLETRFDNLETRFDNLETRFDNLETRFDNLETRFDNLETRFDNLETKVVELQTDFSDMKVVVNDIDKRVHTIEISLENETNRNIQLIAEGHLNLDRKLDEALRSLQPNTMYHLKVNHLDGEVRKIKEAVGMV